MPRRHVTPAIPAISLLFTLFFSQSAFCATTEENWERDLRAEARARISAHIKALDSIAKEREPHIIELLKESRGPNESMVLEGLAKALSIKSTQLREGAVSALGRIGSPKSVAVITHNLRFEIYEDVRHRILRILPVFLINGEQERMDAMNLLQRGGSSIPERILSELRYPPYKNGMETFLPEDSHRRTLVTTAIAEQLDPIGTAISYLDSKKDDAPAREALKYLLAMNLGQSRDEWADSWRQITLNHEAVSGIERLGIITSIQVAACHALKFIGAEGTPLVCGGLERLTEINIDTVTEAALDTLATIASLSREFLPAYRKRLQKILGENASEMEVTWLKRQIDSALSLEKTSGRIAEKHLAHTNSRIRSLALICLGASCPVFYEGESEEEKATRRKKCREAVTLIRKHRLRVSPDSPEQVEAAGALGMIRSPESVNELASIASYRNYTNSKNAQTSEYRIINYAARSLGEISGAKKDEIGRLAFAELTALLSVDRILPGAPYKQETDPDEPRSRLRVNDLALYYIQKATGTSFEDFDAGSWNKIYATQAEEQLD